jgi:hypothetical protein
MTTQVPGHGEHAERVAGTGGVSARAGLTYAAAVAAGAGLFFLCFGAIFTGSWTLLVLILLCYAAAGAGAVRVGGVRPATVALLLVLPAVPWVTWLFPASVPESGLLRASLWPGLVALMGGLAWLGGLVVRRSRGGS